MRARQLVGRIAYTNLLNLKKTQVSDESAAVRSVGIFVVWKQCGADVQLPDISDSTNVQKISSK